MMRLSCRDLEACSRAVSALYAEASTPEDFPRRALTTLSELVPVEHLTFNEISLEARISVAQFVPERPDARRLLPQLRAYFHTHPLTSHMFKTSPHRIVDVASSLQFRETPVFREYYRHIHVTSQMTFALEEEGGKQPRAVIALNRQGRCFSSRDKGVAAFLSPHVSQAYHNARARAEWTADLAQIGEGLAAIERAVIFAIADGRMIWLSTLAREWLLELFPESLNSVMRLPPPLLNRLSLRESRRDKPQSCFEAHLSISPAQQLTARFIETSPGKFVIVLDRERAVIGKTLVNSLGLTQREGEILFWISEAKADREIAAILGISPRTVHKHVEHLFAKLAVANRAAAQRVGRDLRRL